LAREEAGASNLVGYPADIRGLVTEVPPILWTVFGTS
jgi:hypothetical protein